MDQLTVRTVLLLRLRLVALLLVLFALAGRAQASLAFEDTKHWCA
mgnify:CR=1 FL=1